MFRNGHRAGFPHIEAITAAIIGVGFAPVANGASWVVDPDGGGDFTTIQAAIDAASSGDDITVNAGTYDELIGFSGKDLFVASASGPSVTTIRSATGDYAVSFISGESAAAVLDGFTLTHAFGLGILVIGSSPTLRNLVLTDLGFDYYALGAGAYINGGSPTFENTTFSDNTGYRGADVYVYGGALVTFTDSVFSGATADDGGSIYVDGADLVLDNTHFSGALARSSSGMWDATGGGAIFATGGASLTITASTFEDNIADPSSALFGGGAIYAEGGSDVTIDDSVFTDNSGKNGGSIALLGGVLSISNTTINSGKAYPAGGAIYAESASLTTVASIFDFNSASSGGAFYLDDVAWTDTNSSFDTNKAEGDGGAVYTAAARALALKRSVFTNSSTDIGDGGALFVDAPLTDITIQDASFTDNVTFDRGGAIVFSSAQGVSIVRSVFTDNFTPFSSGGAIHWDPATDHTHDLRIARTDFENNSGYAYGGAVYAERARLVSVRRCQFLRNGGLIIDDSLATTLGGAIAVLNTRRVRIVNNLFHDNSATTGGALYLDSITQRATIRNNILTENSAEDDGGGLYFNTVARVALTNNTLLGNAATQNGGHLYQTDTTGSIINNIFAFATGGGGVYAADGVSGLPRAVGRFRYNDVYGNTGGDYGGTYSDYTGLGGNISLDPEVVAYSIDGDETNDDLTLTPTSLCVDAGTPRLVDPDGSRSDMGAYGGPGA
jgi:hypothetical protein